VHPVGEYDVGSVRHGKAAVTPVLMSKSPRNGADLRSRSRCPSQVVDTPPAFRPEAS
jgi:hypothetical protein